MAHPLLRHALPSAKSADGPVAQALAYSRAKLAGSDFHYAVLAAPSRLRPPLAAVYALWRELDEIAEECRDPTVAVHKLAWWRGEIDAIFEGRPRHPASVAVHALARKEITRAPLQRQLDALHRSLSSPGFDDIEALEMHARDTDGALVALAARLLAVPDASLADLGVGLRLARVIAGLGADARSGRLALPGGELARRGISPTDLLRRCDGEPLRDLLGALHRRSLAFLDLPASLPSSERTRLRSLCVLAALARATLEEIARDGYRVLDHGVELTPLRKLWLAWRGCRAGARG